MIPKLFSELKKEKLSLCNGCMSFRYHDNPNREISCSLPPVYNDLIKCPCVTCLVKFICREACLAFGNFKKSIPNNYVIALGHIFSEQNRATPDGHWYTPQKKTKNEL